MQISFTNKQNFNARNITIRRADNLAREVNKMFPSVSPSKMSKFGNYNFFESISDFTPLENIKSTMQTLRNKLAHAYYCRAKDIDCLISFLDNLARVCGLYT